MIDNYSTFNRLEPIRYVPRKGIAFYRGSPVLSDEENKAFKHLIEISATEINLEQEKYNAVGQLHQTTIVVRVPERYGKTVSRFLKLVAPKMACAVNQGGFGLSLIEPDPLFKNVVDGNYFNNVYIEGFETSTPIRVDHLGGNQLDAAAEFVTLRLSYSESQNSIQAKDILEADFNSILFQPNPLPPAMEKVDPVEKPAKRRKPTPVKKSKVPAKKAAARKTTTKKTK